MVPASPTLPSAGEGSQIMSHWETGMVKGSMGVEEFGGHSAAAPAPTCLEVREDQTDSQSNVVTLLGGRNGFQGEGLWAGALQVPERAECGERGRRGPKEEPAQRGAEAR